MCTLPRYLLYPKLTAMGVTWNWWPRCDKTGWAKRRSFRRSTSTASTGRPRSLKRCPERGKRSCKNSKIKIINGFGNRGSMMVKWKHLRTIVFQRCDDVFEIVTKWLELLAEANARHGGTTVSRLPSSKICRVSSRHVRLWRQRCSTSMMHQNIMFWEVSWTRLTVKA